MTNSTFPSTCGLRFGAALAVAALALAACGSDDAAPELPEGGTGNAYNDAIIESESHDEIIFARVVPWSSRSTVTLPRAARS